MQEFQLYYIHQYSAVIPDLVHQTTEPLFIKFSGDKKAFIFLLKLLYIVEVNNSLALLSHKIFEVHPWQQRVLH